MIVEPAIEAMPLQIAVNNSLRIQTIDKGFDDRRNFVLPEENGGDRDE
ncbi:hypothetical protein ACULNC_04575 [Shigella flexneri]